MAKIPVFSGIRIIPRENEFLDRRTGSRGEIFYDRDSNTLRLFDGINLAGISLAKNDLSNVSNSSFLAKANAAGVGGAGSGDFQLSIVGDDSTELTISQGNTLAILGGTGITTTTNPANGEVEISNSSAAFFRIAVDGEGNVDASQPEDILNLEAGDNILITVDADTKTVTIATTAGAGVNSFSTISISGQSNVVADSNNDTLTLVAGTGISLITDASNDTITINNTVTAGGIEFSSLGQVSTASLTIDQTYLPAITSLTVSNTGATAYLFDQYTGNNPTIYAINGTTIAFKLTATGHPFLIQNSAGVNYSTGLIHVSTTGVISLGASAQGKDSGTLYWKIPTTISGGYRYQCGVHAPMVGSITIKDFATI